jgi:hypothetical protein
MLIKLIYILFIATTDFFLYFVLNRPNKINAYLIWSFLIIFILVCLLHTNLVRPNFLLSLDSLLSVLQFLIGLIVFHFVGKYYINKIKRSTRLAPKVARGASKMASFIFQKAIYVMVFITQCMFILNAN